MREFLKDVLWALAGASFLVGVVVTVMWLFVTFVKMINGN